MGAIETKTFKSGNSVAVRLPKELGMAADMAIVVGRTGDMITIRPAHDKKAEKRKLDEMIAALRAIGPIGEIEDRSDLPERPASERCRS